MSKTAFRHLNAWRAEDEGFVLEVSFAPNINHIPAQLFEVALAGTYRGQTEATVHIEGQPCGFWPSWNLERRTYLLVLIVALTRDGLRRHSYFSDKCDPGRVVLCELA